MEPMTEIESTVELPTGKIRLLRAGAGEPLLVLHRDIGSPGWLPFYQELAGRFEVLVPDLPGYGNSERPDFARHPRDIAIIMQQFLDKLTIDRVALVGLGFGGWIAAEMATMAQRRLSALVLVAPMGLLPEEGDIYDQMLADHIEYVMEGFGTQDAYDRQFGAQPDPQTAYQWDLNKEMTARIAWKPYMISHQLPHLLRAVETRTLLVWGQQDKIVPLDAGRLNGNALPNAHLEILPDAGHSVEMESPVELAKLVTGHVESARRERGSR